MTWQTEITKAEDLPFEILPLSNHSKVQETPSNSAGPQSSQSKNYEPEMREIRESVIDVEPPSNPIKDIQLDSWDATTEEESAAFWGDSEETSFVPESEQDSDQVASDLINIEEAGVYDITVSYLANVNRNFTYKLNNNNPQIMLQANRYEHPFQYLSTIN